MVNAPLLAEEFLRLDDIRNLNTLDTTCDIRLDRITNFAALMLQVPICTVSIVDKNRVWFKSLVGLETKEIPRDISFCGHAIYQISIARDNSKIFEVSDTHLDNRFSDNPLVINAPFIRSYISCAIESDQGNLIGTLCAMSTEPRAYTSGNKQLLCFLTKMAENIIHNRHHLYAVDQNNIN